MEIELSKCNNIKDCIMNEIPLLSICVTCRDNREDFYEDRGGTRLAKKVFQELKKCSRIKD